MNSRAKNKETGQLGEDIACRFLMKHGFEVVERNYWKKWGEIDIVAKKGNKLHFVEVKSVSREINPMVLYKEDSFRPEDNLHPWKLQRLSRVIQTYLLEKDVSDETEWQFDVITVYLDMKRRVSKVYLLEDIVL
jgi:putative endonuclease